MGISIEDLDGHEGYAGRRLTDGTVTSRANDLIGFQAFVPACECGWRGTDLPPTADGEGAATEAWRREHAEPLLCATVPGQIRELSRSLLRALDDLSRVRPEAGVTAIQELKASLAKLERHRPRVALPDLGPLASTNRPGIGPQQKRHRPRL